MSTGSGVCQYCGSPIESPPAPAPRVEPSLERIDLSDLSGWDDTLRHALASDLVKREIPHRFSGTTLTIAAQDKALLDQILAGTAPSLEQTEPTVPNTAGVRPTGSVPLTRLERLVALRDAGGLTAEEFETARAKAARELVQDDE